MSYERWDRPWSDREYVQPPARTRVVRELRLGDFFWAALILFFIVLFSLAAIADAVQVCLDIFRAGKSSKVTDHQMLVAVAAIVLGPPMIGLCCWMFGKVVRGGAKMAIVKPDTYYIRRRW